MKLPFYYDTASHSNIRWSEDRGKTVKAGQVAWQRRSQVAWVDEDTGKTIYSTIGRVVWMLHHGPIEGSMRIYFLDGDSSNTRIENLELVTPQRHAYLSSERYQKKGVKRHKDRWHSTITSMGRSIYLGSYSTELEATIAHHTALMEALNND